MENAVPFVAKISKAKTRSKEDKDYYVFRINIPKEAATKLSLAKDDFIFFRATRAQWYHMLKWKEMRRTWDRLPDPLKSAIQSSGVEVPYETYTPSIVNTVASPPSMSLAKEQRIPLFALAPSIATQHGAN